MYKRYNGYYFEIEWYFKWDEVSLDMVEEKDLFKIITSWLAALNIWYRYKV